jgi:hypothetical protein
LSEFAYRPAALSGERFRRVRRSRPLPAVQRHFIHRDVAVLQGSFSDSSGQIFDQKELCLARDDAAVPRFDLIAGGMFIGVRRAVIATASEGPPEGTDQ